VQLGAMIFNGSHMVDFYHDKYDVQNRASFKKVRDRAFAFEAEYLRLIGRNGRDSSFTDYQKSILRDFPDGVNTAGVEWYDWTPLPDYLLKQPREYNG
jgi:hypothetical protein